MYSVEEHETIIVEKRQQKSSENVFLFSFLQIIRWYNWY